MKFKDHYKHPDKWHTVQSLSYADRHNVLYQTIKWCKQYKSKGMFYYQYTIHPVWYFELEEDALMFAIKWG